MLSELLPVRPSWVVRNIMRPLTRTLNPVSVKMAGRPGFRMAGRLHHVGRRSGAHYVTPVGARIKNDHVLIPLTFGNQSDWSRNVLAAGRCCLRLEGVDYEASAPALVSREEADPDVRAAFGRLERSSMRMLGIRQFLRLSVVPTRP
jgi:deazaflavin-dependent oxidoreductase (nitroreductase family)